MMLFQKGIFIRFFSQNKIAFLNLSIIVLIFCAVFARYTNKSEREGDVHVYLPIENVETKELVYSVTANITGDEKDTDIKLVSQVMKGLKSNITFFINTDWIKENKNLFSQLKKDGHSFGIIIENNRTYLSQSEAMTILANENSKFYEYTDIYPKMIRIEKDKSGKIAELINAFGQVYISSSANFYEITDKIKPGDIILIDKINENTAYDLAEFIGSCSKDNMRSVDLEKMVESSQNSTHETQSE